MQRSSNPVLGATPLLAIAAVLLAVVGGCGDGSPAARSGDSLATTAGQTGADSSFMVSSANADVFAGDTVTVSGGTRRGEVPATLVSATSSVLPATGGEPAMERAEFQFDDGPIPAYQIGYVLPPYIQCGSGAEVAIDGGAVLHLRLSGTNAHRQLPTGFVPTITERNRRVEQPLLRQLTLTCDFEGEVEWFMGLSERVPFRVTELSSPTRLVVELRRAGTP